MELTNVIRDKVREALMVSLPPEELDKFISEEWGRFFKDENSGYYTKPSTFKLMLHEEIQARAKLHLTQWMDANFSKEWKGQEEVLVGDMVRKFTPIVLQELSGALASRALAIIHERLQIQ